MIHDQLALLDALTDDEADNLRTYDRDATLTWAIVQDSVQQMPDDILAQYGDPADIRTALAAVVAEVGSGTDVGSTYGL